MSLVSIRIAVCLYSLSAFLLPSAWVYHVTLQSNRTPKEISSIENNQLTVDVATRPQKGRKTYYSLSQSKWSEEVFAALVERSSAKMEESILRCNITTPWKYFYEGFKQYRAEVSREIESSISKWSDLQLREQSKNSCDYFYEVPANYGHYSFPIPIVASKPRMVELLEKDKILEEADNNLHLWWNAKSALFSSLKQN